MNTVTTSGWYENDNGSVTFYFWQSGRLCEGKTLADWSAVSEYEGEDHSDLNEIYA